MIWTVLLAWLALSFLADAWLCLRGWLLSRKQDRVRSQRFASDFPLIYYDAQPHEWERLS